MSQPTPATRPSRTSSAFRDAGFRVVQGAVRGLRRIGLGRAVAAARRYAPTWYSETRATKWPLVPRAELTAAYARGLRHLRDEHGAESIGAYLEFGVFYGDSLLCMARVLEDLELHDVHLFGFDSFEGLPPIRSEGDEALPWEEGNFKVDYESTRARLARDLPDPARVTIVRGWFDDTLVPEKRSSYGIEKASVIMVDCDLYSSAKTALEFAEPLIRDRALIFFDDWDGTAALADRGLGEKRAFDELLAAHPDLVAEEFDEYLHSELDPPVASKVFLVTRSSS